MSSPDRPRHASDPLHTARGALLPLLVSASLVAACGDDAASEAAAGTGGSQSTSSASTAGGPGAGGEGPGGQGPGGQGPGGGGPGGQGPGGQGPGGHGGEGLGGQGSAGGGGQTSAGGAGGEGAGGAPVAGEWAVTASIAVPAIGLPTSATELAAHPSDPSRIALSFNFPTLNPTSSERKLCTSANLGVTTTCSTSAQVDSATTSLGLSYDPTSFARLADAYREPAAASLLLSENHGATSAGSFTFSFFSGPVLARFTSRSASRLVVRASTGVYVSLDQGMTWQSPVSVSCAPPGNARAAFSSVAWPPVEGAPLVALCDVGAPTRCDAGGCSAVALPDGVTLDAIAASPHPPARFVALGRDADAQVVVLASSDGGATFAPVVVPRLEGSSAGRLVFDPRPSRSAVVASIVTVGRVHLWHAAADGDAFVDVTPPEDLAGSALPFRVSAFDVAADGAILALSEVGVLARRDPSCTIDADCAGSPSGNACDASSGRCVVCAENLDCSGFAPVCDPLTQVCGACSADLDCAGQPFGSQCSPNGACGCLVDDDCSASDDGAACIEGAERCGCLTDLDCSSAEAPLCQPGDARCRPPCSADADCASSAGGPLCDLAGTQLCVECVDDGDCAGHPFGSECDPVTRRCGCTSDLACADPSPLCDLASERCVGCLSDADCPLPGDPICDPQESYCITCFEDAHCTDPAAPTCIYDPLYPGSSYCI